MTAIKWNISSGLLIRSYNWTSQAPTIAKCAILSNRPKRPQRTASQPTKTGAAN